MATKKKTTTKVKNELTGIKPIVIKARGRYKIVEDQSHAIEASSPETRSEDQILNQSKRLRLLDLTRNLVRNSSLFNTILGQLTTNVVSSCGGKVILSIPNETANNSIKNAFYKYTRNVDFYTGDTLNHMLKRILREYVIGGDVVLMFDDNLVEDSGKVMIFESNELVNVSQDEVQRRYGKGCWISNGKVYSKNGRHIGTVVSKSQRGASGDADPSKCYFLKKDPNSNPLDNSWFQFSSNWREGRGVSQAASAIATIHQLEDLVQSELMASRRNAQVFCWISQQIDATNEQVPSAFDDTVDFTGMTPEQVEQAIKKEVNEEPTPVSFNKAKENSIIYEALPEGMSAQQLTTQHPNNNIQTMVDFLANRCAASLGLSKVFATGNPTDSDWRSNQLFSYPAIVELQKEMETLLDWLMARFVKWATRVGQVKARISEDFIDYVDWSWKSIDQLNPVENENAIALQLRNMTKSYKDILGPDYKDKLLQIAEERKWMLSNGITPPQDLMKSGGQTESSKSSSTSTSEEVVNNEQEVEPTEVEPTEVEQ